MDKTMTDGEYQEFLNALAYRHLVANWQMPIYPAPYIDLYAEIDKLASSARLLRVVSDRPDNTALLTELSRELQYEPLKPVLSAMERSGVIAALEDIPEVNFANLRSSAVPPEDLDFLRRAGVERPEAELALLIQYCRTQYDREKFALGELGIRAPEALSAAIARIQFSAAGAGAAPAAAGAAPTAPRRGSFSVVSAKFSRAR